MMNAPKYHLLPLIFLFLSHSFLFGLVYCINESKRQKPVSLDPKYSLHSPSNNSLRSPNSNQAKMEEILTNNYFALQIQIIVYATTLYFIITNIRSVSFVFTQVCIMLSIIIWLYIFHQDDLYL